MDLVTAGLIAKLTSDAVGALDKIFRGLQDYVKGREPRADNIPPPDFRYVDDPETKSIVAESRRTNEVFQRVTYDELCARLGDDDLDYISTLSGAMSAYQKQWTSIYSEMPMASGLQRAQLEQQLDYVAKQMMDPLVKILDFVRAIGLHLDDHYMMARSLAEEYLSRHKVR